MTSNELSAMPENIVTRTTVLNEGEAEQKRSEILQYFHKSFDLYESLFDCLANENAFTTKASPLRHPLIFYFGHTAVFYINKLNVAKLIDERVDPALESSLAIGVDEMSWDDLNDKNYPWPTSEQVKAYRDKTRTIIDRFIRTCDVQLPVGWDEPLWMIMMGIEHERIHLETSTVLIRELPLAMVKPHSLWSTICTTSNQAPENSLLPVAGGAISIGKSRQDPLYGWDVEYGTQTTEVADFKAGKFLVSNQEFFEFMQADGYATRRYWTDEGWGWISYRKATHPVFWVPDGESYQYRTMLEVIDMPWDWPVDVAYLEAKAFCNWKSEQTGLHIRMPTESEWHALRNIVDTDQPYWDSAPGNINLEYYASSCPVNRHQFPGGFHDIIGNVWQWSETPVDALEGFEVHPAYDDFSTPTFDGKHNIFKGGCWASTGNYAIKDARYAFRRHFYQHSGFRYIQADPLPETRMNVYEKDDMVAQYIEFHYGDSYFGVPNFPVSCIAEASRHLENRKTQRALDIGCATGRSSFELARHFDHVDALDFSARLIQAPTALQSSGIQRFALQDEGDLVTYKEVTLDELGYKEIKDKVSFMQGDACNLPDKFADYDMVFAGNLIDRLYDPSLFLEQIKARIRQGGLLVITSPYTWLEEFTEKEKWLGGFKAQTGENYSTLDGLRDALAPEFRQLGQETDVPFVIRETRRKYQHSLAQLTVWEKIQTL
ncbi:5-histidylcysteine sulfoxide synthase [Granulosicoccus antarcticus]|uniref:Hercynine oxygenase n=1 Tax=Granulosicoccus antarcticus IMCC3135 TaxID=1192854 RepID=A0A2Z2NKB6_9GAMM|nr:5-histidylcysteine sulfoxide synthase [Granulosicoccus antarcticus]ASJ71573.1 Hercynine oxygenase [Granulosicoccus antarcticus IMCC3135]